MSKPRVIASMLGAVIFASAVAPASAEDVASAASSDDDGIVIISVAPRDPSVKAEILLTPAKEKKVAVTSEKPEPAMQLARAEEGSR